MRAKRHTLYGCVDWNKLSKFYAEQEECHTLYGCVDWNITGTKYPTSLYDSKSHPVWVCGLKP